MNFKTIIIFLTFSLLINHLYIESLWVHHIIIVKILSVICVYTYFKYKFTYWNKRGINGPRPTIPLGNLNNIYLPNECLTKTFTDIYKSYPNETFVGLYSFNKPMILLRDIKIARDILIKDFNHFTKRGLYSNIKIDPLSESQLSSDYIKWKPIRNTTDKIFTPSKTKSALDNSIKYVCEKALNSISEEDNIVLNVNDLSIDVAFETLLHFSYGVQYDKDDDTNVKFRKIINDVFFPDDNMMSSLLTKTSVFAPHILNILKMPFLSIGFKRVMTNFLNSIENQRKHENIERNDLISSLLNWRDHGNEWGETNTDGVLANVIAYFAAGFETIANLMAFVLFNLTIDQSIQNRVRNEINDVLEKNNGLITYETLQKMDYLIAFVDEISRMNPGFAALLRTCTMDYHIPEHNLTIEKGVKVIIPLEAFHYNEELFPNPHKVVPERFLGDNKPKYYSFGDGRRRCPATLYSKMTIYMLTAELVRKYRLVPTEHTPSEVKWKRMTVTLSPATTIYIKLEKLKEK